MISLYACIIVVINVCILFPSFNEINTNARLASNESSEILPSTHFQLYTKSNIINYQLLDQNKPEGIKRFHFKRDPKLYLLSCIQKHGYVDDPQFFKWDDRMKNQLLKHDDYNVIVVDWSWGNKVFYDETIINA